MASRLAGKQVKLTDRFAFFRDQRRTETASQRRVLESIMRQEADAAAERHGVQKPSEMSDFERKRVARIQNFSLKTKAYLSLLGFDMRIFPTEVVQPDVTQTVLPRFPKIATLFAPFAMGLALTSPVGMIPSVLGLGLGAAGFGLLRAALAARLLKEEAASQVAEGSDETDPIHYEWKRNELELFSLFTGVAGLAAVGSLVSNPVLAPAVALVPMSWYIGAKVENPTLKKALFAATAPLGLLAGGAVTDIYTTSQIAALGGLLWAGWSASHGVFARPGAMSGSGDFLKAGAMSAACMLGAASPWVGDMHRAFVIFGFPAVSALTAQAYTNTYRPEDVLKYGRSSQGTRNLGLQERHALVGMLFLLAFMTGRAYSTGGASSGFAVVYGDEQKF